MGTVLPAKCILFSVCTILGFTQLCYTAQPSLTEEGTRLSLLQFRLQEYSAPLPRGWTVKDEALHR